MRTLGAGLVAALLAPLAAITAAAPAANAAVGEWHGYETPWGVCTKKHSYQGVTYQACHQNDSATHTARTVAYVSANTRAKAKAFIYSRTTHGSWTLECPTITLSKGVRRTCITDWHNASIPTHWGSVDFYVNGHTRPGIAVVGVGNLKGWAQKKPNWCGPSAIQAALRTSGQKYRTQKYYADLSKTKFYGTLPKLVQDTLNLSIAVPFTHAYIWHNSTVATTVSALHDSVQNGRPAIVLVNPNKLPGGSGAGTIVRHYIVVYGFAVYGPNTERFAYWNPWDASTGELTVGQLTTAAYGAWYLASDKIAVISGTRD